MYLKEGGGLEGEKERLILTFKIARAARPGCRQEPGAACRSPMCVAGPKHWSHLRLCQASRRELDWKPSSWA